MHLRDTISEICFESHRYVLDRVDTFSIFRSFLKTPCYFFSRLWYMSFPNRGLPFSTYAPRVGGWGQVSYTFPLRITCKKGWVGPDSM